MLCQSRSSSTIRGFAPPPTRRRSRARIGAGFLNFRCWIAFLAAAVLNPLPAWSQFKEPERTGLAAGTGFDWLPTISSDLLESYFVSVGSGFNANWDIWSANRQNANDPWRNLQPVDMVNTPRTESAPHLSPDGLTLTFTSDEREGGFGGQDLWQSTRMSPLDPWQEPVNMGPVINARGNEGGAAFSPDGLEIIYDRGCREPPGVCGLSTLRRSTRSSLAEPWSEPETMSSTRSEHQIGLALHPSISPNGLSLYYEARDEFGEHDIFVSTRASLDAPFGPGENLGDPINTRRRDIMPRIAPDGSLYYIRNWTRGQRPAEIWRAEAEAIAGEPGDFDANGVLDISDIDDLMVRVAAGENPVTHDLNNDAMVNTEDIRVWIKDLSNTYFGDANLDGEFNSGDMVQVFQAGKYELDVEAGWAQGDWTGDQRFDSGDLVAAFQDGGYELGARAALGAVPEPSCAILLGIGMIGLCRRRKRKAAIAVAGRPRADKI